MNKVFISIIIPSYNRSHYIRLTIDSFLSQSYPQEKFEIIIANNNSTDDTELILKEYASKTSNFRYFNELRQGVHYARNSAAKLATGDILYYTDDDMIADKDLLSEITKLFLIDEKIASATGKVLPKWTVTPPDWIIRYCNNHLLSLKDIGEEIIISKNDIGVFSCHQAMRKEVFMKSGGFNPENTMGEWMGDGETGLNIKIKSMGYKFAYNPKSITYHIIPQERTTQQYLNKRFKNQGSSDSYTALRLTSFTAQQFFRRFLSYVRQLLTNIFWFVSLKLKKNDQWRLRRGKISYYISRIKFDARFLYDKKFRGMVLKIDWLNESNN